MARSIKEFETNKNAVIIHYPHLYPYGPAYKGEKPTGCVVSYNGYSISASIYEKGFRVWSNKENFSKVFATLKEAKIFIIEKSKQETYTFLINFIVPSVSVG